MQSSNRYDPSAAAEPIVAAPQEESAALQSIKDRIARNQAKREGAKNVDFDESTPVVAPDEPAVAAEEPKGILKQTQAQPKPKTKAKAKYLKRKLDRKKSAKKQSVLGGGEAQKEANAVEEQEDRSTETPEQKAERKKQLKEARRLKRAQDAEKTAAQDSTPAVEPQATTSDAPDVEMSSTLLDASAEPPKKKRKHQKASDAPAPVEEPIQVSAKDEKALQKAAKAAAKSRRLAANAQPIPIADEPAQPDHPDALPRFPRPAKLAAPDKSLLAQLSVAEELQGGLRVDPSVTVKIDDLVESTSKDGPKHLLSERARGKLADLSMTEFFAVQSVALPLLLDTRAQIARIKSMQPRDLCFNAPTGSGKTLAYVLPIVEILAPRVIRRLRALVVLPTRDLVLQVKETFDSFCAGTDLKVGTASGQHTFAKEQEMLSGTMGRCGVDILIATPGRLCDHIASGNAKLLEHLQYLVIDEADRLLDQSFNEWLPVVLAHLKEAQDFEDEESLVPRVAAQKLLFSATLSRDPKHISRLNLYSPLYIAVTTETADVVGETADFSLPPTLKEHMLVTSSALKPLMLVHLLKQKSITHGLCFTKSIESASRLVKLVEFMEDQSIDEKKIAVRSFSSDLPVHERGKLLAAFKSGEVQLLVCSDLIARGMDISHVTHVVNYDVPVDMRKYVHRVGRTARAGREGDAWSLVESQEALYFKNMLKSAGRLDSVDQMRVRKQELEPLMDNYEQSLERLKGAFTHANA